MQAFARIPSSPGPSGTSLIPGYSFNSSGYGYEGFIQPKGQEGDGDEHAEGSGGGSHAQAHEAASTQDHHQQQQHQQPQDQQMKVGVRSQVVEDMYAVPENYLEIEGARSGL